MVATARVIAESTQAQASIPSARDTYRLGRGSNWIHPALTESPTAACGYGAFASAPIPKGTVVVVYGGNVLTTADFENLTEEMQHFPFQIGDDLFLAPRDEDDIGVGERINHSCDPNVGFSGAIHLIALRDIRQGEQLFLDYATCVASDGDAFVMKCACGSSCCRGIITGEDWKLPDIQERLLSYFQPFLQSKVAAQSAENSDSPFVDERRLPTTARNDDPVEPAGPSGLFSTLLNFPMRAVSFVGTALRNEWLAIPICVVAGIPSTLVTCAIMEFVAPAVRGLSFVHGEFRYVSIIASLSSVVGYATYLVAYYIGMLIKERRDWLAEGRVDRAALYAKWRVIKYDFVAHLPTDFWIMPLIGVAQGGLLVAGMSQFWSIFTANLLADIAYAAKEPLFWHGAKQLVAWRDRMSGSAA